MKKNKVNMLAARFDNYEPPSYLKITFFKIMEDLRQKEISKSS